MESSIKSYKDLIVWQKSLKLAVNIYGLTKLYPSEEKFGLISQLRRSSISVPSNIAEGSKRSTRKEYCQFLRISLGSLAELETQILISNELNYIDKESIENTLKDINEIERMLSSLISKLDIKS